jgi:hypothetical protein
MISRAEDFTYVNYIYINKMFTIEMMRIYIQIDVRKIKNIMN